MMVKPISRFFFLPVILLFALEIFAASSGFTQSFLDPRLSQQTERKDREPAKPELFLLEYQGKNHLKIGLYFKIEPGWHLYWLNPGEAGLPPQVEWELPAGFSLTTIEYPTPEKFLSSGYIVYGYKSELILLACFSTPEEFSFPAKTPTAIKAKLNWMVCQESCLLGKRELDLDLASKDLLERKEVFSIWERFKSRFPRPQVEIKVRPKEVNVMRAEEGHPYEEIKLLVELEGEDLPLVKDFYPLPLEEFIINENKTNYNLGKISMSLIPLKEEAIIEEIKGLLITNNSSFVVNFPIKNKLSKKQIVY